MGKIEQFGGGEVETDGSLRFTSHPALRQVIKHV